MMPKLMAKMYRMKMLSEVRDFVESLPFSVVEKKVDHCVYCGIGHVDTGSVKFPTTVQILRNEFGRLSVVVAAPKAGVKEEIPFETPEQRKKASAMVQAVLPKYLN